MGSSEEHHILPVFQEAHGGQLVNLSLVDSGLEIFFPQIITYTLCLT